MDGILALSAKGGIEASGLAKVLLEDGEPFIVLFLGLIYLAVLIHELLEGDLVAKLIIVAEALLGRSGRGEESSKDSEFPTGVERSECFCKKFK